MPSDRIGSAAFPADGLVLQPVDPKIMRERDWHDRLATMGGYLFDIRIGGGPETFTAWTVRRDDIVDVPFVQATGDDPVSAVHSLIDRLGREFDLVPVEKVIA